MFRIVDWGKHFENNRSRELKSLDWVPIPNKHDGDGYTELVAGHPNGSAHYGVWCSLVQVASKCDPRGTLVRDGARAHDSASLSRMTRHPEPLVQEAIERLVNDVRWLEFVPDPQAPQEVTKISQASAGIPHPPAGIPHPPAEKRLLKGREGNGTEKNGREGNGIEGNEEQASACLATGTVAARATKAQLASEEPEEPLPEGLPSPAEFFTRYREFAGKKKLAVPLKLTEPRRLKIRVRLREPGWFLVFLAAIKKLPLGGSWQPDLDWLLANGTNAYKLAEGTYDNWGRDKRDPRGTVAAAERFLSSQFQEEGAADAIHET